MENVDATRGWKVVTKKSAKPSAHGSKEINQDVKSRKKVDAHKVLERRALRPKLPLKISVNARKRSWSEVCASSWRMSNSLSMSYIAPEIDEEGVAVAVLTEEMLAEGVERWENTIVGYVVGDIPYYGQIRAWATRMWKIKGICDLILAQFHRKDNIGRLVRMVLAAMTWHIWKERNRRIFEGTSQMQTQLFENIADDIRIALRHVDWDQDDAGAPPSNWGLVD